MIHNISLTANLDSRFRCGVIIMLPQPYALDTFICPARYVFLGRYTFGRVCTLFIYVRLAIKVDVVREA